MIGQPQSFFMHIARNSSIVIVAIMGRLFMTKGGTFRVIEDDNYAHLLKWIQGREDTQPLITVCNHRSMADDFCLMGSMMPLWMTLQAKYHRWGICTQNICFENGDTFGSYAGAGKSLPIWRGGGIDQKLLLDVARLVSAGEWIHIFPEAGCYQHEILGGRYNFNGERQGKGRLKWGVGKLIAHSTRRPIVVPFYHSGMEHVLPQEEYPRKLIYKYPQLGHNVSVQVGEQISFDDLIEEHEQQYGPLRKITETDLAADERDWLLNWQSKESDKILYNKITCRIEQALLDLGAKMPHYKGKSILPYNN